VLGADNPASPLLTGGQGSLPATCEGGRQSGRVSPRLMLLLVPT
jgi:hypothetical protein